MKSDSHETWKCADAELERQIRCFPYGEHSWRPTAPASRKKSSQTAEESRTKYICTLKFYSTTITYKDLSYHMWHFFYEVYKLQYSGCIFQFLLVAKIIFILSKMCVLFYISAHGLGIKQFLTDISVKMSKTGW